MGNDATLVLKANNQDYINKMKEAQKESQKVYDTANAGEKRERGILQEIEDRLTALGKKRKEAFSYEEIAKYNKKIEETKQNLKEYEEAGLKADKQTGTLTQTIGKWVLGLGLAVTVMNALKEAFLKTQQGMVLFNQAGAAMKQVLSNIVNGVGDWTQGMAKAAQLAKEMALLQIEDKRDSIERNKLYREYNELYTEGIDATISQTEKIDKLTQAKEKFTKASNKEIEDLKKQLRLADEMWKNDPTNLEAEGRVIDLMNKINDVQGQIAQGTRRLTRQITAEQKRMWDDLLGSTKDFDKELQKEIDDRNKEVADADEKAKKETLEREKKYQELNDTLIEKYRKANIDSLTGVPKLEAVRDFALNEINALKTQLLNASLSAGLGGLTDAQNEMIDNLRKNVQQAFLKGMEKEAKATPEQKKAISKALMSAMPNMDELRPMGEIMTTRSKPLTSIWQIFGIDPEDAEGKKEIENFKKASEEIFKIIDDTAKKRIEDAQRERELLDTKISETENELNTETELYKAGYASNVDAKRKELAQLKVQRDAALKQEQEAIKKQRQIDALQQASSLLTASANIIKGFSSMPIIGQVLAIAAIAAMFAAFASARAQANKATSSFAKGGWTGYGDRRDETGERVAGTVHGEEYVVRKGPASKFRDVLEAINKDDKRLVLNRFNRISSELKGSTINNVTVENDGPNKRLDTLITLNKRRPKEEITELADQTIIRKGNSTRIVRK